MFILPSIAKENISQDAYGGEEEKRMSSNETSATSHPQSSDLLLCKHIFYRLYSYYLVKVKIK